MIRKLINFGFSKMKPVDAFKSFLEHDIGASVRRQSHHKERKYVNVEISQKFREEQTKRKQFRLEQITLRKNILQQKLNTQSKLLTSNENSQLVKIKQQISSLELILIDQNKNLEEIERKLQESQADLVLVEGVKKIAVLNHIDYLKHMNYHPTGLNLHPQTVKVIENVHYLVNNNLPVNKFKLFQIMPELFKQQIGELDESIQKLIVQKRLDPDSDPSSRIRFFVMHKTRFQHPEQGVIDLQNERNSVFQNMETEIVKIMRPHMNYVKAIQRGQTPFRSFMHMLYTFLSPNMTLTLNPEEQALKNDLIKIAQLKDKFAVYSQEINNKIFKVKYRYIEPPVWIQNHPLLLKKYEQIMVKFTNPIEVAQSLQIIENNSDDGQAYLQQKLYALAISKYNPIFEQLWNAGKKEELMSMKKKFEIDFYNDSTKILQEYNEMMLQKKDKEEFLKIPKVNREITTPKFTQITLDELTKSLFINNSNPVKYNLSFFTNFLGIENEQQTKKLFNSFRYLQVKNNQANQNAQKKQKIEFQILQFKLAQ